MDANTKTYLDCIHDCEEMAQEILTAIHDDVNPDNVRDRDVRHGQEIRRRMEKVLRYIIEYRESDAEERELR